MNEARAVYDKKGNLVKVVSEKVEPLSLELDKIPIYEFSSATVSLAAIGRLRQGDLPLNKRKRTKRKAFNQ